MWRGSVRAHLVRLQVGFRNRLFMMFHWAWSWLTYKRGARLITGAIGQLPPVNSIADDGSVVLPPAAQSILVTKEPDRPASRLS